jgi:hypothetical protein
VQAALSGLAAARHPMTVLFDVLPLPDCTHEPSGLALLDAVAQDLPEGTGLAVTAIS